MRVWRGRQVGGWVGRRGRVGGGWMAGRQMEWTDTLTDGEEKGRENERGMDEMGDGQVGGRVSGWTGA